MDVDGVGVEDDDGERDSRRDLTATDNEMVRQTHRETREPSSMMVYTRGQRRTKKCRLPPHHSGGNELNWGWWEWGSNGGERKVGGVGRYLGAPTILTTTY